MDLKNTEIFKGTEDFDYAVKRTRLILLPFGLWPVNFSLFYHRYLRPLFMAFWICIQLFKIIPYCMFMYFKISSLSMQLKLVGPQFLSLLTLFKFVALIVKRHDLADLFHEIAEDWRTEDNAAYRRIMMKNARTGRTLILVSVILMYGGGMPYVTLLPIARGVYTVNNVTHRHLAFPAYYVFFNPHVMPIYCFIFIIQCMCGFVRYTVTCSIHGIIIFSVMHICSKIDIVLMDLQTLTDNYNQLKLGKIVKSHLHFLKLINKLENIFQGICLIEVMGTTFLICFVGYYFILEYEKAVPVGVVTFQFLLASFVYNIFILCYIGQVLTEKCETVGAATFMIDWYKLAGKDAKNLTMIISCQQRPVALTAGKMMRLHLQSFTTIIKASASYLNILRTTK